MRCGAQERSPYLLAPLLLVLLRFVHMRFARWVNGNVDDSSAAARLCGRAGLLLASMPARSLNVAAP